MRIICDTHIWYYLGNGAITPSSIEDTIKLVATHNNVDELSRSNNLLNIPEQVMNAIIAIFKYNSEIITDPPFVYLKKMDDETFDYDSLEQHSFIFDFTQAIANGLALTDEQKQIYENYCVDRRRVLELLSGAVNNEAQKIKERITNKQEHKRDETTLITKSFISFLMEISLNTPKLSESFDWKKIELFENVIRIFLLELEISNMKVQPNDWFDLFQLIYVQPGDKIWIREKRWRNLIAKSGMSDYLYES